MNRGCKVSIKRWLHKKDRNSTSNLCKHVRKCFGDEALDCVDEVGSASKAHNGVQAYVRSGDLLVSFTHTASKGKVTYSVRQHTRTQTRSVPVLYQYLLALTVVMLTIERRSSIGWQRVIGLLPLSKTAPSTV